MNKGARIAIVAGIIVAVGIGATVAAVSMPQSTPQPPVDNGNTSNSTDGEPRQIIVELNETMSFDAK